MTALAKARPHLHLLATSRPTMSMRHVPDVPYQWFRCLPLGKVTTTLGKPSQWLRQNTVQPNIVSDVSVRISNRHVGDNVRRNWVGLKGATHPHWALEVTRGKQGGTWCIQMSSNWGAPRGNLRFIYRTPYKQGTNIEKDAEWLHKKSAEWLHNGKMVVQSGSRGNDKGLTNLQHDQSSYQKWQLQQCPRSVFWWAGMSIQPFSKYCTVFGRTGIRSSQKHSQFCSPHRGKQFEFHANQCQCHKHHTSFTKEDQISCPETEHNSFLNTTEKGVIDQKTWPWFPFQYTPGKNSSHWRWTKHSNEDTGAIDALNFEVPAPKLQALHCCSRLTCRCI